MPRLTDHPPIAVGQKWLDEDGYRLRVVAVKPGCWIWLRPDYGRSKQTIQTHRKWLRRWTLVG